MRFNERKAAVLAALDQQFFMTFKELEDILDVSPTTIRRDLTILEQEGLLARFHGGVEKKNSVVEKSMSQKQTINVEAKKKIGRKAASLIRSNELVYIGSGSTTFNMIPYITDTSITVITNGIPHAEALNAKGIRTFLLCGFLKEQTRSLVGDKTTDLIESYQFNQVFTSANGIGSNLEILSADEYEHNIKKAIIKQGKQSFVMVDSLKFDKTAMYSLPIQGDNMFILTEQFQNKTDFKNIIICE